ncbi:hypothetical protein CesoFtcFv8_021446 [Champsocephalus esox]|uniref:Uncharacterized protein n=1 Tax=Champsocephalus esox TaxID=159716 RepID=A0AAN8BCX2_9TELE|nr:hypothetical protein CesoFtcFv8_021446 [Champsocephalus esox]
MNTQSDPHPPNTDLTYSYSTLRGLLNQTFENPSAPQRQLRIGRSQSVRGVSRISTNHAHATPEVLVYESDNYPRAQQAGRLETLLPRLNHDADLASFLRLPATPTL